MPYVELSVDQIEIKSGPSPLDEAVISSLVESMNDVGLINPITVWRPTGALPQMIAGRHRLEAAKRLGWNTIRANVLEHLTPAMAADADAIEIVENLHRRELPQNEKDRLVARYVELVASRQRVSKPEVPKLSARGRSNEGRPVGASSMVARTLGVTKKAVNQAVARDRGRSSGEQPSKSEDEIADRAAKPKSHPASDEDLVNLLVERWPKLAPAPSQRVRDLLEASMPPSLADRILILWLALDPDDHDPVLNLLYANR